MSKKRSTFIEFVDKNEELAELYEQTIGESLWNLPNDDVEKLAGNIASDLKMSFSSVLNNCVNMSILRKQTLLEILEDLNNEESVQEFASNNSMQKYFKEINDIYTKNNNNYDIEFKPENRERILSMNLKSVIAIAKCYQGLGIDFEDLIGAGNEGLCHAWEKYDPSRACLKENMINAVNEIQTSGEDELIDYSDLSTIVSNYLSYGKTLKKEFIKKFKEGKKYTKKEILAWIDLNIVNAKFNSVACKWIKAYIIQEINKNSRMIKKPKSEIDKEKNETGSYKKEVIMDLDAKVSNGDSQSTFGDFISAEEDSIDKDSYENEENYRIFKNQLNILLTGVKSRDRRILLKKFGIGTIRPLQPNEIAVQENLSVARISQIIGSTIETMIENSKTYKINKDELFEALSKLV